MIEQIKVQITIVGTEDAELDAIQFIRHAVKHLEPEQKARVLRYAEDRIRADTYGSQNVDAQQGKA